MAVSEEDLVAVLDAANRAPSAHNQQSWRFIVLRERAKNELAELINGRAGDFPRPSSTLLRMAARSVFSAPVVVAVANTGELMRRGSELFAVDKEAAHDFFRTMEIQSSAAAVENLLLAATSLGVGSVWLGVLLLIKTQVLEFLDEPGGEFMAVVALGVSGEGEHRPQEARPGDARSISPLACQGLMARNAVYRGSGRAAPRYVNAQGVGSPEASSEPSSSSRSVHGSASFSPKVRP